MEKMSLDDAGLKDGAVVVLEDGAAPKPGQITISFAPASLVVEEAEIVVEKVNERKLINDEALRRMLRLRISRFIDASSHLYLGGSVRPSVLHAFVKEKG